MTIISSISMIFMMPLFGLNQGSQPIIGYNYGAKNIIVLKMRLKSLLLSQPLLFQ